MTLPGPAPGQPALMRCPQCTGTTEYYCTINDRFALCPPCAERVRVELTTLTFEKLARGVGAALATAFGVCVTANVILASLGPESEGAGWIQSIAAIFMGTVVGRAARRGAKCGGLPLQLATVAIAAFAVLEMFAGVIYAARPVDTSPVLRVVLGIVGSPVLFGYVIYSGRWFLLFWIFWAVYDPWRVTRAPVLDVRGPFPVQVTHAPPPPAAPAGGSDAKAAGLDFERPQ